MRDYKQMKHGLMTVLHKLWTQTVQKKKCITQLKSTSVVYILSIIGYHYIELPRFYAFSYCKG